MKQFRDDYGDIGIYYCKKVMTTQDRAMVIFEYSLDEEISGNPPVEISQKFYLEGQYGKNPSVEESKLERFMDLLGVFEKPDPNEPEYPNTMVQLTVKVYKGSPYVSGGEKVEWMHTESL